MSPPAVAWAGPAARAAAAVPAVRSRARRRLRGEGVGEGIVLSFVRGTSTIY
jgi:hypothetical protein